MANHKSAEKRHKQSLVRRQRNRLVKASVRTAVKKARAAISEASTDKELVVAQAESQLAKAAAKGVLHKKTASRLVSRLAKRAAAERAAK
jgi:small subunit ribosomal protein S20